MIVLGCLAAGEGKDWSNLSDGCHRQSSSHLEKTRQDKNDKLGDSPQPGSQFRNQSFGFFHRTVIFAHFRMFALHGCATRACPSLIIRSLQEGAFASDFFVFF